MGTQLPLLLVLNEILSTPRAACGRVYVCVCVCAGNHKNQGKRQHVAAVSAYSPAQMGGSGAQPLVINKYVHTVLVAYKSNMRESEKKGSDCFDAFFDAIYVIQV